MKVQDLRLVVMTLIVIVIHVIRKTKCVSLLVTVAILLQEIVQLVLVAIVVMMKNVQDMGDLSMNNSSKFR